jgi:hypothetical protein
MFSDADDARDRVLVRFADDEIIEGRAATVDLDQPDFELALVDPDANSERALIPLPSVKSVTLERRALDDAAEVDGMQKVALRFRDGEVLCGLLVDGPRRQRYGVTVELLSPGGDEVELLGIPYDNLKAVFFLKSWDSRPPEFTDVTQEWSGRRQDTPLLDLLGEIHRFASLRDRGEISADEFGRRRLEILDRI